VDRHLPAHQVKLPASIRFTEPGHCEWCNKPLTGRATCFCPLDKKDDSWHWDESRCTIAFHQWWYTIPAFKRAIFIRDNFTCRICGYHEMQQERPWLPELSILQCDHIIPVSRGGPTEISNLRALCASCNGRKGAKMQFGASALRGELDVTGRSPVPKGQMAFPFYTVFDSGGIEKMGEVRSAEDSSSP